MADFRQKTRLRNYLARSEQRRLLVLVMTLGLVVLLTIEAAKPERWFWMWGGQPPAENAGPADNGPAEQIAIDNRMAERTAGEGEEGFRSPAAETEERGRESISADDLSNRNTERPKLTPDPLAPSNGKADSPKSTPDPVGTSARPRYFPGVKSQYLKTIRDDTILRRSESDAFYHLLEILAERSERELRAASAGRVTFAQLFQQSNEYRGDLVTIRGTVRLAVQKTAPANAYGVGEYYELWMVPHDQRDNPLVVNCLELPAGFPRSDRLAEEAGITGFFFKRFAYQAGDGRLHTTPLLLAKAIDWTRAAPVADAQPTLASFLWCLAAAVMFAIGVLMYVRRRSASPRPSDLPDHVEWSQIERNAAARQADASQR
ncbi:MAG: hypothetical protein HY000_27960 [Planctomycetes bacterium]|nr:hypothetical protein [Planctomycetota bacterium]